ncbi:hypothetical protein AGDE_00193 [Angomonas deanei]|uniref:Transmembrane protein n=1 Tax=Angomonas deanei TaxID=59799 RepID=S9V028_9TRYP|nr:hypothetical protein AGDE_06903 [Angomonas deanei]EPY42211.1 hypothetical protein AGDE_01712 [Angomonas deanei]EPY43521.1 hypothetical protein AGDE_00400 [Angomonas deanei]EPY43728.1 hypothetical protein AGDE_00193 [Angomonas deanei]CAD2216015.1 hypothetical protein, conserved [Angomonas deanei]|eukprot:EPY36467.1 hypothetical protein AGDE_06903 [Angomonas deanei]
MSSQGGGGARDVGTVTAGMAIMNFDEKTKPYTRQDMVNFLTNYETNLNEEEKRLIEKGMLASAIAIPGAFAAGYVLSGRLAWHRIMKALDPPGLQEAKPNNNNNNNLNMNQNNKPFTAHTTTPAGRPNWIKRVPTVGRICFGVAAASIPYVLIQQWFVAKVLDMNERESGLSFNLRRLMLAQRSGMMFQRTATREITREEQNQLLREAEQHVVENRSGKRAAAGLGTGPTDVNLQLSGQVLTPVAQTGYKAMPKS